MWRIFKIMAGKLCFKISFFLAKVSQEKKKEEVCVQYILSNKDYNIQKKRSTKISIKEGMSNVL